MLKLKKVYRAMLKYAFKSIFLNYKKKVELLYASEL